MYLGQIQNELNPSFSSDSLSNGINSVGPDFLSLVKLLINFKLRTLYSSLNCLFHSSLDYRTFNLKRLKLSKKKKKTLTFNYRSPPSV